MLVRISFYERTNHNTFKEHILAKNTPENEKEQPSDEVDKQKPKKCGKKPHPLVMLIRVFKKNSK